MKKTSAVPIAAILFFFLPIIVSCARQEEKTLIMADIIQIDKNSGIETISSSLIGNLVFSPLLYKCEPGAAVHNVLIEEIKVLAGDRGIEVKLKEGIKFHNGHPLTSKEIIHSIDIIKYESGGQTFKDVDAEIIDRLRFRLKSNSPISAPLDLLSTVNTFLPTSTHVFNGTGPFRFKRWVEKGVELEANNDYFEGAPKLKKIIYLYEPDERNRLAMLLKDEADLMAGTSPGVARFLEKDKRFKVYKDHTGFYVALFFNCKSPLLSDKRIRKAISMGIDRNAIIEKVLLGAGAAISSPFPPELAVPGESKTQGYRPREAIRILREAGWKEMNRDGILSMGDQKLKLNLYYLKELQEHRKLANLIIQQLFEIGIEVESFEISEGDIETLSGSHDIVMISASYSEHYNINRWLSSSPGNLSGYINIESDRLLDQAFNTGSVEEKRKIYGRIAGIFEDDVPGAFLYAPVMFNVLNKKFKGVDRLDYHIYSLYRIKDWDMEIR